MIYSKYVLYTQPIQCLAVDASFYFAHKYDCYDRRLSWKRYLNWTEAEYFKPELLFHFVSFVGCWCFPLLYKNVFTLKVRYKKMYWIGIGTKIQVLALKNETIPNPSWKRPLTALQCCCNIQQARRKGISAWKSMGEHTEGWVVACAWYIRLNSAV